MPQVPPEGSPAYCTPHASAERNWMQTGPIEECVSCRSLTRSIVLREARFGGSGWTTVLGDYAYLFVIVIVFWLVLFFLGPFWRLLFAFLVWRGTRATRAPQEDTWRLPMCAACQSKLPSDVAIKTLVIGEWSFMVLGVVVLFAKVQSGWLLLVAGGLAWVGQILLRRRQQVIWKSLARRIPDYEQILQEHPETVMLPSK